MHHVVLLVMITTLLLAGCDEQPHTAHAEAAIDVNASRVADGTQHVSDQSRVGPLVIADPQIVAAAKAAWQEQSTRDIAEYLDGIREGYEFNGSLGFLFEQHREESIAKLKGVVATGREEPTLPSVAAASVLRQLNEPSGVRHLLQALQSADEEVRAAALKALTRFEDPYAFSDPAEQALVLALMDGPRPDLRLHAFELCQKLRPAGFESKVRAAMNREEIDRVTGLQAIASVATDPAVVDELIETIISEARLPWKLSTTMHQLLNNPDAAVSSRAREALVLIIQRYGHALAADALMMRCAAKHGGQVGIQWLEDILGGFPGSFSNDPLMTAVFETADLLSMSRHNALESLVEAQPERRYELAQKYLDVAPAAAAYVLVDGSSPSQQAATLDLLAKVPTKELQIATLQQLLLRFGQAGRGFILQRLDRLPDETRAHYQWPLEQLTLVSALSDFQAAGVLVSSPDESIERWRRLKNFERFGITVQSVNDRYSLVDVLLHNGAAVEIRDPSIFTDDLPPYDRFLLDLPRITRGEFEPQCVLYRWQPGPPTDDQWTRFVQFISADRLYRFTADDNAEYDPKMRLITVNQALRDQNRPERLISWPDVHGQIAIFGDPHRLLPLLRKYHLCEIDDVDNPLVFKEESDDAPLP